MQSNPLVCSKDRFYSVIAMGFLQICIPRASYIDHIWWINFGIALFDLIIYREIFAFREIKAHKVQNGQILELLGFVNRFTRKELIVERGKCDSSTTVNLFTVDDKDSHALFACSDCMK